MADPPDRTASTPDEEIMRATYRALRDHGYANLTIKRIAEKYGKSTAAIHYHYETKDDLLAAFLDHLLDRFVDTVRDVETTDPEQRLDLLLDKLIVEPEDHQNMLVAMLEMRSQAPFKEAFRERFQQNDEYIRYMLKAVVNHGIDEGVFADVDADHAARALMTIVDGGRTRTAVLEEEDSLATARRTANEYVSGVLAAADGSGASG